MYLNNKYKASHVKNTYHQLVKMNKGLPLIYEVRSKIKEEIRSGLMNLIYIIHLIFFLSYYKIG